MKTKVEINGYEIEISEMGGQISVRAAKGGEVIEEFTLEAEAEGGEGQSQFEEEGAEGSEIKGFDEFEEEEDFTPEQPEIEEDDNEQQVENELEGEVEEEEVESEPGEGEVEEEEVEKPALESFQTFINKKKKTKR